MTPTRHANPLAGLAARYRRRRPRPVRGDPRCRRPGCADAWRRSSRPRGSLAPPPTASCRRSSVTRCCAMSGGSRLPARTASRSSLAAGSFRAMPWRGARPRPALATRRGHRRERPAVRARGRRPRLRGRRGVGERASHERPGRGPPAADGGVRRQGVPRLGVAERPRSPDRRGDGAHRAHPDRREADAGGRDRATARLGDERGGTRERRGLGERSGARPRRRTRGRGLDLRSDHARRWTRGRRRTWRPYGRPLGRSRRPPGV